MSHSADCCASPLQYATIPDLSSCGYSEGSTDSSPSPPMVCLIAKAVLPAGHTNTLPPLRCFPVLIISITIYTQIQIKPPNISNHNQLL